ncbi:collagen alpha-1(I) chain-like [Prinia subflava]|uniref:collagen alpha-1(I) chain-like n=1 Tax=Prinia subflava TaxID=208062 RepID=UPI002FDF44ED
MTLPWELRIRPRQVGWGAGVAIGAAAVAGAAGRRQEASGRQGSRLSFLCLPSVTGHKSHEASRKTRRCPEFKHSTPATPGPQLPAGAENPANTVGSRCCVGGTISAGRGSCCRLAAEPGTGPALRALPAAGGGRGSGGRRARRALPSGRGAPGRGCGPRDRPGPGGPEPLSPPPRGAPGLPRRPRPRGAPRPDGARTGPAAGGATLSFPGDPSSRPPRVLKWWVGRPPSPSFSPLSRPPRAPGARPSPPPQRRGAAAPPSGPARAPRGSGARPAPLPGTRQRRSREHGNASPGNTATPPPAAALTCAGLTSRGRGQRCPPRRPSAAASPPPCAGPQCLCTSAGGGDLRAWMCDSAVPPHGELLLALIPGCIQLHTELHWHHEQSSGGNDHKYTQKRWGFWKRRRWHQSFDEMSRIVQTWQLHSSEECSCWEVSDLSMAKM